MKIHLYLSQYELTFEGIWDCLFFPNVGENLYIFPFLTEEDKVDLSKIKCGDTAEYLHSETIQRNRDDFYLLPVLYNRSCLIKQKIWSFIDNEWVCSFDLEI